MNPSGVHSRLEGKYLKIFSINFQPGKGGGFCEGGDAGGGGGRHPMDEEPGHCTVCCVHNPHTIITLGKL